MSDTATDNNGETAEDLLAEVLGPSKTDDVLVTFDDGDDTSFSVEFVDFEDPPFRAFNVAGTLPAHIHGEDIADAVSLQATDASADFVVLESEADDAASAVDELSEIATAAGVTIDDIRAAEYRQIETGFWNELAGKIMKRLGMGRYGRGE